jgi:hypothetical protein
VKSEVLTAMTAIWSEDGGNRFLQNIDKNQPYNQEDSKLIISNDQELCWRKETWIPLYKLQFDIYFTTATIIKSIIYYSNSCTEDP